MLTLAHDVAAHDLWASWNLSPPLVLGLILVAWAYRRGRIRDRRGSGAWRGRCFAGALVALGIALISPLDALSGALASAHMIQHVLLLLVAAPLLALSASSASLLRGMPVALRRALGRARGRLGVTRRNLRVLRHAPVVWLLHAGTIWLWHAGALYDAAVESVPLHVLEHGTFLVTGLWFWRVVMGARAADRAPYGVGILLVFTMALQSVFLSLLLTFARTPWYSAYSSTTGVWGIEPLADQQLAGAIMWIPAGIVYLGAALALLAAWLRTSEREDVAA